VVALDSLTLRERGIEHPRLCRFRVLCFAAVAWQTDGSSCSREYRNHFSYTQYPFPIVQYLQGL